MSLPCCCRSSLPSLVVSSPKPTRPDSSQWTWSWKIPTTASQGSAKLTVTCAYGGISKTGGGTFKIVNGANPNWSISAVLNSPVASGVNADITGVVTIHGAVPYPADTASTELRCWLDIVVDGIVETTYNTPEIFWSNGDGPLHLAWAYPSLDKPASGSAPWTVRCYDSLYNIADERKASGSIAIT